MQQVVDLRKCVLIFYKNSGFHASSLCELFPDLLKRFFELGKTSADAAMKNYIAELGLRGILCIPNPDLAAKQSLGLIDEAALLGQGQGYARRPCVDPRPCADRHPGVLLMAGSNSAPLAGPKVVELARILAGPWIGQTLADLGAEVIKIESPQGDDTRSWGPPFIERPDGKGHEN